MMLNLLSITDKSKSLLIRLLASFLLIISLLASFSYLSFNNFQKNIYHEIVKYNELNLKNTVDNYENYLVLMRNILLGQSFNSKIIMLSNNNEPDYIMAEQVRKELGALVAAGSLPNYTYSSGYEKLGDYYYFYKKGTASNLTYLNIVPLNHISSQIFHLKMIFITLLVVSVIISFITSVWFSVKFNNPNKKIMETNQNSRSAAPLQSTIKEFDFISSKILDILLTSRAIQEDLATKNSLVKYYAYINKLKKIHTSLHDMNELHFADKPFVLVLVKLHFRSASSGLSETNEERISYYFREFIHCLFSEHFKNTHTFQIEKDQILTIQFLEEQADVMFILQQMKQVFDIDKNYCTATIAVSPVENDSSQLTMAYQQALRLLEQRRLIDEAQIITVLEVRPANSEWTAAQEQEFLTKLHCGNAVATAGMLFRLLDQMLEKEASAAQVYAFADMIIAKVVKAVPALQLKSEERFKQIGGQIESCHTPEELKKLLEAFINMASDKIAEREPEHDHIIHFVTSYLKDHLDADISLDLLAKKLNITRGYLSTYFKEKTGSNYLEYVNSLRVDRAKLLLQDYTLHVKKIAEKIGYTNVNSFIRMFKKYTGITPGEYRKKYSA